MSTETSQSPAAFAEAPPPLRVVASAAIDDELDEITTEHSFASADAPPGSLVAYEASTDMPDAPSRPMETAGTLLLVAYGFALTVAAAPVLDYATASAEQLASPAQYVQELRAAPTRTRMP